MGEIAKLIEDHNKAEGILIKKYLKTLPVKKGKYFMCDGKCWKVENIFFDRTMISFKASCYVVANHHGNINGFMQRSFRIEEIKDVISQEEMCIFMKKLKLHP